jgi:hypothetical protein
MYWKAKKIGVFMLLCFIAGSIALTYARNSYLTSFHGRYQNLYQTMGSALDDCLLCHPSSNRSVLNSFATAYADAGHDFAAIESIDSDRDGFSNLEEIAALTFPGDASSYPDPSPPATDNEAPVITWYGIPEISDSLTVPVSALSATDNVGVSGFRLSESTGTPSADANGWEFPAPSSYTFNSDGFHTLYAWAKDAAGNVSSRAQSSTTITLPDQDPPAISSFTMPASSDSMTVPITSLSANDNIGVTGFWLSETRRNPSPDSAGWVHPAPDSYIFASEGTHTLYAWAKDAAGNVSSRAQSSTTIALPSEQDTTPPQVTAFSIPANSDSLAVAVTAFSATDNVGVTGYLLTISSDAPYANGVGWSASPPSGYTFASEGTHALYAWAKDNAGNVSSPSLATVSITLPPETDTTPPQVTAFSIPLNSDSLTVSITAFSATDNIGVTGYLVSESAGAPVTGSAEWSASPISGHTFSSEGTHTLYAWAKDAEGNVSASRSASTTITLPDTTAPTVNSFTVPASSGSLTVHGISITASDDTGVTGYLLTESSSVPSAGSGAWSVSAPSSHTFSSEGTHTIYAWAKDAAGNVSSSRSASTTITLPSEQDNTPPSILSFSLPDTSDSLTVPIISFSATDNVGVTEYMFSTSAETTSARGSGWTSSPPNSYTFASEGVQTLYAWVRDAAGNVSSRATATTNIGTTIPDPDTEDMWIWDFMWFQLKMRRKGIEDSRQDAYLYITGWDPQSNILNAVLYTQDSETLQWEPWDMPLHYTSGYPLRFLCWFEFAGEYNFSASITGKLEENRLSRGTFKATGLSHSDLIYVSDLSDNHEYDAYEEDFYEEDFYEDDSYYEEDSYEDTSGNRNPNGKGPQGPKNAGDIRELVTVNGSLVDASQVPGELLDY